VPLPLLVTPLSVPVPDNFEMTTVPPLEARLLPFVSFNRTVIVEVDDPFAAIAPCDAVIVDVAAEAGPAVDTIAAEVPVTASSVAETVHEATMFAVVNVTVAAPFASVEDVAGDSDPPPQLVDQVTV
jgi:hypothetical protein